VSGLVQHTCAIPEETERRLAHRRGAWSDVGAFTADKVRENDGIVVE
jgi:hypothetical protein